MKRVQAGFLIGAIVTVVGVLLAVGAENLATNWQMIGANAWGGTTDPDKAHLYQTFGLITAVFGLFLTGASFYQWLTRPRTVLQ